MSEATAPPGIETPANKDDWATMNSQTAADTLPHADAVQPAQIFEQFSGEDRTTSEPQGFDMIMDIPVALTVELGRTKISIRNLLQLAHGSIVELDGLAGEPMDILINGTLIAQGEVVVVNEKFGIRLTDIITPQERIRKLNR
ncbi:MAG: flagellar motor switch protein FliN [Rugosibacter sp.]|jgi:flagellar motor switch protein FliN|nr:flagellar motor switch protein FliN [Rugosibacter sp.]MDO9273136.1 flagellar motor switch protein FliN [Rugosibacter sp.]